MMKNKNKVIGLRLTVNPPRRITFNFLLLTCLILTFYFLLFTSLFAGGPGTTSGIFLRQPLGARSFGMGNAYTGVSNDIEALWFNAAGICEIEYPVAAALFSNDISGTNNGFLAYALPFGKFTLAAAISALQTEKIEITPMDAPSYNITGESDYIATTALGIPIGNFLDIGGAAKFLHSQLAQQYTAQTVVFDEGVLLRGIKIQKIGDVSAGISYQNLGGKLKYDEAYNNLPQILRGGVAIKKTKKDTGEAIFDYDISKITGSEIHHNFGIELSAFDRWLTKPLTSFSIRAGYGFGYSIDGASFGIGFGLKRIRCDYGLQLTDFETRHKFLLSYSFEPASTKTENEETTPAKPSVKSSAVEKSTGTKTAGMDKTLNAKPVIEKPVIAMLNLPAQGVQAFEASGVTDLLRKAIDNTEAFTVIDPDRIDQSMEDLGLTKGCTDQNCAMQVGKDVEAKKVIAGYVSRTSGVYTVNIRIMNVKTGKTEYDDKGEAWSMDGMEGAADKLAQRLAQHNKETAEQYKKQQAKTHFNNATKLYHQGKYKEAISEWEEVLKFDPENKSAKEKIEETTERYKNQQMPAHFNNATRLYNQGKFEEAISEWEEVLKLDPENELAKEKMEETAERYKNQQVNTRFNNAEQLYNQGKFEEAISEWTEILKLDPEHKLAKEKIEYARKNLADAAAAKILAEKPAAAKTAEPAASVNVKPAIAVLSLQAVGVQKFEASGASDLLRKAISNTEAFTVIDPDTIDQSIEYLGLKPGCTEQSFALQVGKDVEAKKVIAGSLSRTVGGYAINIRIMDVETGKTEYDDKGDAWSMDGLESAAEKLAQRLFHKIQDIQNPPKPQKPQKTQKTQKTKTK